MKRPYRFGLLWFVILLQHLMPCRSSGTDASALMQEADDLFAAEKDAAKVTAAIDRYAIIAASGAKSYEANWKLARAYYSLGNRLPWADEPGGDEAREERKRFSQHGMDYAWRAFEENPAGLEGHYYYAICLSQYSIAVGGFRALAQGKVQEYKEHMDKVVVLNRYYDNAGPLKGLGRYFYYIPWPIKDIKKSIAYLEEAVTYAPENIRARVYLAESYLEAEKKDLARTCLDTAVQVAPDETREYDALRWKKEAEKLLHSLTPAP
jgi:tetratricopeptide (TPR) repeat protein